MVTFLLFILAGIGITNLAVNASILDNPRDFVIKRSEFLGKLLACMMCSGFWTGFIMGLFGGVNPLYSGAAISLLSFTFGYITEYAELAIGLKAVELDNLETVETVETVEIVEEDEHEGI